MNVVLTIRKPSGELELIEACDLNDAAFMASMHVEAGNQAISISMDGTIMLDEIATRRLTRELAVY